MTKIKLNNTYLDIDVSSKDIVYKLIEIDIAIHDMRIARNNIIELSELGFSLVWFPSWRMEYWQENLDRLKAIEDSDPVKKIYNHETIGRIAKFLRLNY